MSTHISGPDPPERNCPFYGRHGIYYAHQPPVFMEQGGNQCAIITDSYSPCQMELAGKPVDWKTCHIFTRSVASMRGGSR